MAHAQKADFVSPRNGRVHSNRWGRQFSRLLAAEVCVSAWVMLDRPRSEVAWEYWLPTPFASFPFASPPCDTVCHQVPNDLYHKQQISLRKKTKEINLLARVCTPEKFIAPEFKRGLTIFAWKVTESSSPDHVVESYVVIRKFLHFTVDALPVFIYL